MKAKGTVVPGNETAIFTEDGQVAVAIPKDKKELSDADLLCYALEY
jgi:hypothetical protein